MTKKKRGLPIRQIRFVKEYMIDNHGGNAAIRAGYAPHSAPYKASALLRKEQVQALLAKEMEKLTKKIENKLMVTKEQLIADLLYIKELHLKNPKSAQTSIKAIEVINKMLGYNEVEKTDITTNGQSINDININIIRNKPEEDEK